MQSATSTSFIDFYAQGKGINGHGITLSPCGNIYICDAYFKIRLFDLN